MSQAAQFQRSPSSEPQFQRERHIKYHLRCLKTLLPTQYTPNDSNRMLLAFLTLNALDLLSALDASHLSEQERQGYIDWIYHCQLPTGGFKGFTGADPGRERRNEKQVGDEDRESHWDPANLAGTFFALVSLIVLGDDLQRIRRKDTLSWLHRLQWEKDGSLGEVLGSGGQPEGERDIRFCYMGAAIRYILRSEKDTGQADLNVEKLADFVLSSQAFDGGFGRQPMYEGNAGWTYCAIACLYLLGRLKDLKTISCSHAAKDKTQSFSVDRLVHWLVSCQIPCPDLNSSDHEIEDSQQDTRKTSTTDFFLQPKSGSKSGSPLAVDPQDIRCAGLNGRCNKPADTCYSFWAVGALDILGHADFIDWTANRSYLLERTQHLIGGFGKTEGDPPDVLHSSLGLAALSFMNEPGIKRLETALCLSVDAHNRLEKLRQSWNQVL